MGGDVRTEHMKKTFSLNQVLRSNCVKALLLLFIVSGATLGVSSKEAHSATLYSQPDDSQMYFSDIGDSSRRNATSSVFNIPVALGTTTINIKWALGISQPSSPGSCSTNTVNGGIFGLLYVPSGDVYGRAFSSGEATAICTAGASGGVEYLELSFPVYNLPAGNFYFYKEALFYFNFTWRFLEDSSDLMYIEIADSGGFTPPGSEITMDSPTEQTYVGNPITFEGEYTNADTFDQIQFDLVSTSYGINVNFPSLDIPLSNVVDEPWSTVRNVPFNGNYDVRVRLYDSFSGSTTPYTDYVSFAVGTTTPASTIINDVLGATVGSATSSLVEFDNLFSFLNIPQLLQTKEPFAYFPAISTALRTAFSDSVAPSLSIVSVPLRINGATTTLTLFSSSTVTQLMTPTYVNLFRSLEAAVIWFLTAMLLYHRARSKHII